jgi:hypothetical protein
MGSVKRKRWVWPPETPWVDVPFIPIVTGRWGGGKTRRPNDAIGRGWCDVVGDASMPADDDIPGVGGGQAGEWVYDHNRSYTVQFLFLFVRGKSYFTGRYIFAGCHRPFAQNRMSSVVGHVKDAAHAAHAHVAALLSHNQAKPGDKLPLNETVKETDATTPITLAPSGKNIFVRHICRPAPPSL